MSNDNTESIRDKLRRWADESENDNRRHIYPTFNAYDDLCIEVREDDYTSERKLFRRIADEIDAEKQSTLRNCAYQLTQEVGKPLKGDEDFKSWLDRYYLPRPLFDDGEPVQFDDRFVNDSGRNATLSSLNYTKGDHDYVSANGGKRHKVTSRLKCLEPQVLDADGVPIVVGDTVWNVFDDQKRTVIGFRGGKAHVESGPGIEFFEAGHELTHREPDSQERIDADMPKTACKYFGASGKPCDECPIHGSKIGCSNEKMRDLLRRQRELDGRDA